jgi:uncharacterized protein HemX
LTTLDAPMTRRLALITTLLVLAVAAPASAQSGAFGPLPQAEPSATPTPTASTSSESDTSRNVLIIIGAALLVGFGVMGWMITRDARDAAAKVGLEDDHDRVRSEALHTRQQQNKVKQRKKARAQKRARKVQHTQRKR